MSSKERCPAVGASNVNRAHVGGARLSQRVERKTVDIIHGLEIETASSKEQQCEK
jgi:hypothetical protein